MEVKAYIKNLKISPKKLRFLLPQIKEMSPREALDYLAYLPKKGAKIFYKAIKSALSNAKNLNISEDRLKFKTFLVEEGIKLKRYRPGGKGMVKTIKRRYSHVKIILVEDKKNKLITNNHEEFKKTINSKVNKVIKEKEEAKDKLKLREKKKLVKKVNNKKKK